MVKEIVTLKLDGSRIHKSRWDKNTYVIGFVKSIDYKLGQDPIELSTQFLVHLMFLTPPQPNQIIIMNR